MTKSDALTRSAIILAAGFGSRLQGPESHKLVATVGSQTMLAHHIDNFLRLGIEEIVIVTGFQSEVLTAGVDRLAADLPVQVRCVFNPEFDGPNGSSVLTGVDALHQTGPSCPFWLTMSDHLFSPALFDDLRLRFASERASSWQGALVVDKKLDTIFDMPDATKIRLQGPEFAIGKELSHFDHVDCGLFWCDELFVEALKEERAEHGKSSTSDAVRRLFLRQQFGFWDLDHHLWQDVDTPGARAHAEHLLRTDFSL